MARLIDADKQEPIIEELENICMNNEYVLEMLAELKNQPAVDAEPVRSGKWVLERKLDGTPYCFHCSVCDNDFHHIGIEVAYDYCPNCGAKMEDQ